MTAIWIEIAEARGSTPRDAGTAMKVTKQEETGTIGGGRLEFEATREARELLARNVQSDVVRTIPLGPNLGQCCGGSVTLRFTRQQRSIDRMNLAQIAPVSIGGLPKTLWLWGAGHVGRAVVDSAPEDAFEIVWIDTAPERFPTHVPESVTTLPTEMPERLAKQAPSHAHHLIFTYSHEIDFALCAALLQHDTASIGLIGSQTKRTRFFKRLRALGLDPEPITCPIGDKALGKHPHMIAYGVLTGFLKGQQA